MNLESLIGQTLDSKYLVERELGRGGMGAVYLATHLGTERPVALKVIVPQFMERVEFVERFRREARAAGRLRHPNVVDVTDFGFADTIQGRVAYLVMEYLDGCTLGEILEEEKQLPLAWTLDILEQVCSAVGEAHEQGIIHRDLKPDNIWLEPNQRGGYTVKVLDFGIAKLEEPMSVESETALLNPAATTPTQAFQPSKTVAEITNANTILENSSSTLVEEAGTLIQTSESEKGTVILPLAEVSLEDGTIILSNNKTQSIEPEAGTKLLSQIENTDKTLSDKSSSELTRVGAVLGTPLYMSPEQCRGEKLSPRSDIYSLGVIAYQMLAGKTPFVGEFTEVMDSHREIPPPPLIAKKVPKKVKQVLFSALAKNPDERPPTAEAFASKLRSHSEGFAKLLQRALVIYSEHLPKFLLLALLLTLPHIFFSILRILFGILGSTEIISTDWGGLFKGLVGFFGFFVQIFCAAMLLGTTTWIVAQLLAAPLKPVSLKNAIKVVWAKKGTLFPTVTLQTFLTLITICCFPLSIYLSTIFMLLTPSIIMEDLKSKAAFKRSKELAHRSFLTALAIAILMFVVPGAIGGAIGGASVALARQFEYFEKLENGKIIQVNDKDDEDIDINIGPPGVEINVDPKNDKNLSDEEKKAKKLRSARRETISQILLGVFLTPVMLLLTSFISVITALMYFKTRQAGGESMQDSVGKI